MKERTSQGLTVLLVPSLSYVCARARGKEEPEGGLEAASHKKSTSTGRFFEPPVRDLQPQDEEEDECLDAAVVQVSKPV